MTLPGHLPPAGDRGRCGTARGGRRCQVSLAAAPNGTGFEVTVTPRVARSVGSDLTENHC
eukprot:746580-Hanusia_phi.AAC.1